MVTWKILGFTVVAESNGQSNVINDIYFSVEVSDETTTVKHNDFVDIEFSTLANYEFVPYENLTEEDLIAFVKNQFGDIANNLEQIMLDRFNGFKGQSKTYIPFTG